MLREGEYASAHQYLHTYKHTHTNTHTSLTHTHTHTRWVSGHLLSEGGTQIVQSLTQWAEDRSKVCVCAGVCVCVCAGVCERERESRV